MRKTIPFLRAWLKMQNEDIVKEMLSAQYSAARASVGANEAVSGLSSEMGEMNLAMQRAQEKVLHMQARADALDTLMDNGALNVPGEDPLAAQLQQITAEHNVDAQLAEMRQQLQISGPGTQQRLIQGPEHGGAV